MRTLEEIKTAMESCVNELKSAVAAKDDEKLRGLMVAIKSNNDDYKKEARTNAFYRCSQTESCYQAAILEYSYEQLTVRVERDDSDNVVDAAIVATYPEIDLNGLYRYVNSSLKTQRPRWADALSKFNQLLLARMAYNLNYTEKQIEKLLGAIKAKEVIDLKAMGKKPCSNTEITKAMQAVVDAILFLPGDNNPEVNKIRVRNNDVEVILSSYIKLSNDRKKQKNAIGKYDTDKESLLLLKIMTMMHMVLTNKVYTLGFKTKKDVEIEDVYAEVERIGADAQKPAEVSTPAETKVARKPKSEQKPAKVSTPAEV